jgi:hypothetical protein
MSSAVTVSGEERVLSLDELGRELEFGVRELEARQRADLRNAARSFRASSSQSTTTSSA